jgi:hypothetical protein
MAVVSAKWVVAGWVAVERAAASQAAVLPRRASIAARDVLRRWRAATTTTMSLYMTSRRTRLAARRRARARSRACFLLGAALIHSTTTSLRPTSGETNSSPWVGRPTPRLYAAKRTSTTHGWRSEGRSRFPRHRREDRRTVCGRDTTRAQRSPHASPRALQHDRVAWELPCARALNLCAPQETGCVGTRHYRACGTWGFCATERYRYRFGGHSVRGYT